MPKTHSPVDKGIPPMSKKRVLKNLVVVSVAIFFYMSAMMPSQELQSSLNIKDGMGTNSMAIGGMVKLVSQMLLPSYCIRRFGIKKTIVASMLLGAFNFFGNVYPKMWSLTLTHVITGIGATPKWTAKNVYITLLADRYAEYTGEACTYTVLGNFFGIYHAFHHSGYVGGNLIAFSLLQKNTTEVFKPSQELSASCGKDFCDSGALASNPNFLRPPESQVYQLFGTFTVLILVAALVIYLFLDDLPSPGKGKGRGFLAAWLILREKDQLLLLPLCYFRSHFRALLTAEFTKAYVTCMWGMDRIGLVLLCCGAVSGACALPLGPVVRRLGRPPLILLAVFTNFLILLAMYSWKPQPDQLQVALLLAVMFGFSNAIFDPQVSALIGLLFPSNSEGAFTNNMVIDGLAGTISHAFSAHVCMEPKIYLSLVLLVLAAVSYLFLEIRIIRRKTDNRKMPH